MLAALVLALVAPVQAATFDAEDLVVASARGLPTETTVRMAETVGTGVDSAATSVYLLRRGVPAAVVRAWGFPVTAAEATALRRLGSLDAPAPGVSDTDWREMAELPTRIERAEGPPVSGRVLSVVPTRAVLHGRGDPVVVERPEARDVWVDATPVRLALRDELDYLGGEPGLPSRVVNRRRGNTGLAIGSILAIAGGMTFLAGAAGPDFAANNFGYSGPGPYRMMVGSALVGGRTADEPSPLMMAAGAVGIVAGSVSFSFGANSLRLADNDRGAWLDDHR